MSDEVYKWSSYIMTGGSLIIGIWSLIVSYLGYFKAKKASVEAENANKEIARINDRKIMAAEWNKEFISLEESGRKRADGLIRLLVRISDSEYISEKQREDMKSLLATITSHIEDIDDGSFYITLHNAMNKAEGRIQEVIDSFLYPSK